MGKTFHEMCQISEDKNRGDDKSSSQGWQFIWREFSTFQPNPSGWITVHNFFSKPHFFRSVQPQNDGLSYLITNRTFFPTKTPWMLFWFKNISRLWCKSTGRQHNLGQDAAFLKNPLVKILQVSRVLTKILLLTLGASNGAQISRCEKAMWRKIQLMGKQQREISAKQTKFLKCWIHFFGDRNFQTSEIQPWKRRRFYIPKFVEKIFPLWFGGFLLGLFLSRDIHKKTSCKTSSFAEFRFVPLNRNEKPHAPLLQFDFAISTIRTQNSMDILGSGKPFRVRSGRNSSKNIPCCPKLLQPVVRAMETPLLWAKNCILSCQVAWLYAEDTCYRNTCQLNDLIYTVQIQNIHM